jgi:hypothetical protein
MVSNDSPNDTTALTTRMTALARSSNTTCRTWNRMHVLHAVAWPVSWGGWRCNPWTLDQAHTAHATLPVAG